MTGRRNPVPAAEVADAVAAALGTDCLLDDPSRYVLDEEPAETVAAPASLEALSELMRLAAAERWKVVPAGLGGWLDVGNPLKGADLIVSTRRLDRVHDYQPADLVVSVQGGVTFRSLAPVLAEEGQWWPLDPLGGGTIGAALATAASGPLAVGYGTPRDQVLGLTAVLADGRVVHAGGRVVKNVAGYDLTRLLIGSWGTLGIIAGAHLRLHAVPAADETRVFFADRHEVLVELVFEMAAGDALAPSAAEILSPGALGALGLEAAEWGAAVRWLGHAGSVADAVAAAGPAAKRHKARIERSAGVWERLAEIETRTDAALTARMMSPMGAARGMIGLARAFAGGQTPAVMASPLLGRVWVFITPALYEAARGERIWALRLEDVRRTAAEHGGHARLERAPAALREKVDVWGDPGPALDLNRRIKSKFDPDGRFAPGRFVAGL